MREPLVSVYVPTRNRASALPRAVNSALQQDYPHLEILVVDDASSDGTPEVSRRLAAMDPRVRVFRHEFPLGASAARNRAIREARGEFVTGLDDDDLMLPGRVRSLLEAQRDEYAFVCSAFYVVDVKGDWYEVQGGTRAVIDLDRLLLRNEVGNQVLARLDRVREAGMFDESQPAWQDYEFWTRMVMRYGAALRIPEPTYLFFASASPDTITNSAAAFEGARRYFERYSHRMDADQKRSQRLLQAMVQRRRLTLRDVRECWCEATSRQLLRYCLRSNLPGSERLLGKYRRWRRPLDRLPVAAAAALGETLA